jgi:hypothetical protein
MQVLGQAKLKEMRGDIVMNSRSLDDVILDMQTQAQNNGLTQEILNELLSNAA